MTTEEITMSGTTVDYNKPFRFHVSHFKRRQQKILFFLTTKKVVNVLKEDIPVMPESLIPSGSNNNGKSPMDLDASDPTEKEKHDEKVKQANIDIIFWKDNGYLCKNYILNGLRDDLYDYYRTSNTTRQVWDGL